MASLAGATASLPEAAQSLLAELQQSSSQHTAKSLHRAVADQARAKQELSKLKANRLVYVQSWQQYIQQTSELLTQQVADQGKALDAFNTAELEWLAAEQQATQALARLTAMENGVEATDQAMMDGEALASDQAAAESRLQAEREQQQQAAVQMQAALQAAAAQAEEQVQACKREGSRTPRRKAAEENKEGENNKDPKETQTAAATPFGLGAAKKPAKPTPPA